MNTAPESTRRFAIRYTGANKAMALIGLRPSNSHVVVGPTDVTIHMGWAFHTSIPRTSITAAEDDHDRVLGWGVHGWRGKWLVNGSSTQIVRLTVEPATRGRVAGFPVRVQQVRVSVEDPSGLIAALG
ncbi:MAG: hypothetical protein R8G01_20740 [Ilumatobacteraceae bacterium]|nr:hypothetical protein [Ilumatobacteraceae bacterium]